MAYAGQILENPVSAERITFRKTAADGHVPGAHVHPQQEGLFEVLKGTMRFRRGLKTAFARAADTVIVPPGAVHRFETATALVREGHTYRKGSPKPLGLAQFVKEFEREMGTPLVPAGVMRAVMAPFVWIAASRGLDERYRRPLSAHADPSYPAAGEEVA